MLEDGDEGNKNGANEKHVLLAINTSWNSSNDKDREDNHSTKIAWEDFFDVGEKDVEKAKNGGKVEIYPREKESTKDANHRGNTFATFELAVNREGMTKNRGEHNKD